MSEEITVIPTEGHHTISVFGFDKRSIGLAREDQGTFFALLKKENAQQLCNALIDYFDLKPADVFDEQWLIGHMADNYWSEMHGH